MTWTVGHFVEHSSAANTMDVCTMRCLQYLTLTYRIDIHEFIRREVIVWIYLYLMKLIALMVMWRGYVYSLTVQITILVEDGMVMLILTVAPKSEKLPIPVTESLSISMTNNDEAHDCKLRAGWHHLVERFSSLHRWKWESHFLPVPVASTEEILKLFVFDCSKSEESVPFYITINNLWYELAFITTNRGPSRI